MRILHFSITICLLAIAVMLPSSSSHAQSTPSFDQNVYYRLTTKMLGKTKALDVVKDGETNRVTIAKVDDHSNQFWKITSLGDGYFRLTTRSLGPDQSLDVIHGGKNNEMQMGRTGDYSGQAWLIKSLGSGYYRLTCEWQGPKKAMGVVTKKRTTAIELAKAGSAPGQYWSITVIPSTKSLRAGTTSLSLSAGQVMERGSRIMSSNRRYSLRFQSDGNLVFFDQNGRSLWDAGTSQKGDICVLQLDGNLVVYDRENHPVWSSETMGYFDGKYALKEWKPVKLEVSNSGVCALRSVTNRVAWSRSEKTISKSLSMLETGQTMRRGSRITNSSGSHTLMFQPDGNLAFYGPDDRQIWEAKTTGRGEICTLQDDGNLVVYDKANAPAWSSETMGYFNRKFATEEWKPVKLQISNSGVCALRSITNRTAWSIGGNDDASSGLLTVLEAGQALSKGAGISSADGSYKMLFKTDGNLAFYGPNNTYIWDAKTGGRGEVCALQSDGNLVVYNSARQPIWSSETMAYFDRKFALDMWKPVKLEISNIGVCALKSASGKIAWICGEDKSFGLRKVLNAGQSLSKGTGVTSPDRSYSLKFLRDGNLVFLGPNGSLIWDSKTTGRGATCMFQNDGNFIIYDASRQAIWSSRTMAYFDRKFGTNDWKPVRLEVSNSGTCRLFSATGRVAWSVGVK
ncbi:MAG: RICIN domain-containing protein [Bacteroidia bacterium]